MKKSFYIDNVLHKKRCPGCTIILDIAFFYIRKKKYSSYCKECTKKQGRDYYELNREKMREIQKIYQHGYYDERKIKAYQEKNAVKIREYQKTYYENVLKNKTRIKKMDNPPIMPKIGIRNKRRLQNLATSSPLVESNDPRQL